jgi:hypothetical protein
MQVSAVRELDPSSMSTVELFAVYRAMWERAGYQIAEAQCPARLMALDSQGYELILTANHLRVQSPVVASRGFGTGVAVGLVPQVLLCASASLAQPDAKAEPTGVALLPALGGVLCLGIGALAIGGPCLLQYRTRAFGKGLLIGAAPAAAFAMLTML